MIFTVDVPAIGAFVASVVTIWGGVLLLIRPFKGFIDEYKVNMQTLETGVKVMLYFRLERECNKILARDPQWISTTEMNVINDLYNAYKDLHGNGVGEELYKTVLRLPKKQPIQKRR